MSEHPVVDYILTRMKQKGILVPDASGIGSREKYHNLTNVMDDGSALSIVREIKPEITQKELTKIIDSVLLKMYKQAYTDAMAQNMIIGSHDIIDIYD